MERVFPCSIPEIDDCKLFLFSMLSLIISIHKLILKCLECSFNTNSWEVLLSEAAIVDKVRYKWSFAGSCFSNNHDFGNVVHFLFYNTFYAIHIRTILNMMGYWWLNSNRSLFWDKTRNTIENVSEIRSNGWLVFMLFLLKIIK